MTLALLYVALFQCAAIPQIIRIIKRRSSGDCSLWREGFVLAGVLVQLAVFLKANVGPEVLISPIASGVSIGTLICVTLRFR